MRKVLMPLLILTPMLPACALFAGGAPSVTTQRAGCSSLIPASWKQGVGAPPIPEAIALGRAVVADWQQLADETTGKLDQANDRTVSTIGIVERCEERDAAAVRQATRRRFLGLF